jgi:hypothetical protein
MSRRIRVLIVVLLASFALGTTACSNVSGPVAECVPGTQGSGC